MRKSVWNIYGFDYTAEPDVRGRTLKQDVDDWLLPPAVVARLEALHAQAQDSGHKQAALAKTFAEATVLLQEEVYREGLVNNYWFYQTRLAAQRRVFADLQARLRQGAQPDPVPLTDALANAGRQLMAALSAREPTLAQQQVNSEQLRAAVAAVFPAYEEQRARLAAVVSDSERAQGVAPLALARTEPCPPPAAGTSGQPKPTFAPDTRAVELDYPPEMRRLNLQGVVVVTASIAATGCVTRAEIYTTSGVPELDQAALRWTLSARYLPAERDHQAVDAVMRLGVRFKFDQ